MVRRLQLCLLIGLTLVDAMLLIYPVRNGITRPTILLLPLALCVLMVAMAWRKRVLRYGMLGIALSPILMFLPGRTFDPVELKMRYVDSLRSYRGTKYVWGGENRFGVDCSGLVRAAMVDAEFEEAFSHLNPRLLREGCWLWWHDIAAKDMPRGYSGRMELLFSSGDVRGTRLGELRAGDVAVTGDGSHVFTYVGEDDWVEADPIGLRVAEWRGVERPTSIDRPMIFLRWKVLE